LSRDQVEKFGLDARQDQNLVLNTKALKLMPKTEAEAKVSVMRPNVAKILDKAKVKSRFWPQG